MVCCIAIVSLAILYPKFIWKISKGSQIIYLFGKMIRCWDSLRHPKWIKHNLWRANNLASFWKNAFYTRWTTLGEHSWAGKSWRSMRHCSILPRKKMRAKLVGVAPTKGSLELLQEDAKITYLTFSTGLSQSQKDRINGGGGGGMRPTGRPLFLLGRTSHRNATLFSPRFINLVDLIT